MIAKRGVKKQILSDFFSGFGISHASAGASIGISYYTFKNAHEEKLRLRQETLQNRIKDFRSKTDFDFFDRDLYVKNTTEFYVNNHMQSGGYSFIKEQCLTSLGLQTTKDRLMESKISHYEIMAKRNYPLFCEKEEKFEGYQPYVSLRKEQNELVESSYSFFDT